MRPGNSGGSSSPRVCSPPSPSDGATSRALGRRASVRSRPACRWVPEIGPPWPSMAWQWCRSWRATPSEGCGWPGLRIASGRTPAAKLLGRSWDSMIRWRWPGGRFRGSGSKPCGRRAGSWTSKRPSVWPSGIRGHDTADVGPPDPGGRGADRVPTAGHDARRDGRGRHRRQRRRVPVLRPVRPGLPPVPVPRARPGDVRGHGRDVPAPGRQGRACPRRVAPGAGSDAPRGSGGPGAGAALVLPHALARGPVGKAQARRRRRRERGLGRQLADGFRDVWSWPLLRWMSVSLILFAVLYFTVTLLFAEAATARYPRADQLAGFLGLFLGVANGAALLVSLLLANRLFARFGLPTMVMGLAAIYVAGFVVLTVTSSFGALLAFRFAQMVWVNGVWAIGWQALFNVVPAERRARTRTFMDAGPLQAGIVLAGALLLLADRVLGATQLAVVGAAAGALALAAMWRARRAYGAALVEALRTGNPDVFRPDEEPFGGFRDDADAHGAVVAGVSDPDPAVRRGSAPILSDLAWPEAQPALPPALSDDHPPVPTAAGRGAGPAGADPGRVRPLLEDPDPEVRAAAAEAVAGDPEGRPAADAALGVMERDPRPEWRAAAAAARGRVGLGTVMGALRDREPVVRAAAAEALGVARDAHAIGPLITALTDPDETVRRNAASTLARIGEPAEDALLAALEDEAACPGALSALAAMRGSPPAALRAFARERVERALQRHRLWLGIRPGVDERLDLLTQGLRHRAVRDGLEALQAAGRWGDPEAMAVALVNLESPDPQQRANALEAIEAVGDPELVRPLLPLWEATSPPGGAEATTVLELLRDRDPWLRASAALAAGAVDRPDLAPILEELARDDADPLVREAAGVALGPVETLSTLSLLERVLFLSKVQIGRASCRERV